MKGSIPKPKPDADREDLRSGAQRRLALRLAASAGLSVPVAAVLVVVALGDGGAQ